MIQKAYAGQSGQPQVRCAIYTRKSTDEGLDQDFNTLDAQRESGEAYIASQKHEGWVCLPDHYDDGGFSGGNLDRPALTRLISDIEAGRVDCIVVYKVDRLSRSLLDFSRLVEVLDRHTVAFVSVTQPINTADSTGRLMLNILLSFAQFERETIADRTRDKMSAARKKGKWCGGIPVLGYDVHPDGGKLIINDDEATMVREIYELYLQHRSLLPVVVELERRGWVTKSWTTKKGLRRNGHSFTRTRLHYLLTNPVYTGKISHKGTVYDGEQEAIVDQGTYDRVRAVLTGNGQNGGARVKNRYGALLKGLLHCRACGTAMSPSTTKKGNKVYRYYVCAGAQKSGWKSCPAPSVGAEAIESHVVDQIRRIGEDPALVKATAYQVTAIANKRKPELNAERRRLQNQLTHANKEVQGLLDALTSDGGDGSAIKARLAVLEDQVGRLERRLTEVRQECAALAREVVDEQDLERVLSIFDPVWEVLFPKERSRILNLVIESISLNGPGHTVEIRYRPVGIKALADETLLQ